MKQVDNDTNGSIKKARVDRLVLVAGLVLMVVLIGLFLFSRLPMWGDAKTTTGASTADSVMEEDRLKAILAAAPTLEGAVKVIREIDGFNRVTYEAVAGNPYGAAAGDYLGEYKKEVVFLQNEIGGVALIPNVVERMMAANKDAIVNPVDITEINDTTEVEIGFSKNKETDLSIPRVVAIDCQGKTVSLSNLITDQVVTNQHVYSPEKSILPDEFVVGIGCLEVPERDLPTIFGDFSTRPYFEGMAPLGRRMATTDKLVGLGYSGMGGIKILDGDDFMRLGTCLVFLIDINLS